MTGARLNLAESVPVDGETVDAPRGVLVQVEISPLECVGACGRDPLPITGFDPGLLAWTAVALLAVGIAVQVMRRTSARRGIDSAGRSRPATD